MKVGDVVVLKSGGPQMTVEEIENNFVYCTWFDGQKERQKDSFSESTLEDVKEVERRNQEQLEKIYSRSRNNRVFL